MKYLIIIVLLIKNNYKNNLTLIAWQIIPTELSF